VGGKSSNPNHSYSFSEMAADLAALVHALRFKRAHVIGHSNGGNVALLYLRTCLCSSDGHPTSCQRTRHTRNSRARDALFTPEWVEANDRELMEDMIALHGPTYGPDYWRDLMRMTLKKSWLGRTIRRLTWLWCGGLCSSSRRG